MDNGQDINIQGWGTHTHTHTHTHTQTPSNKVLINYAESTFQIWIGRRRFSTTSFRATFLSEEKKRKTTTATTTTTTKRRRSTRNRFLHNRISPPPLWTYSDSRFEIFLKEEILESNQIPRIQYRIRWPGCLSHRRPRDSQPFGSGPTYREENVNPNGKPTEMSAGFFFVCFFLCFFLTASGDDWQKFLRQCQWTLWPARAVAILVSERTKKTNQWGFFFFLFFLARNKRKPDGNPDGCCCCGRVALISATADVKDRPVDEPIPCRPPFHSRIRYPRRRRWAKPRREIDSLRDCVCVWVRERVRMPAKFRVACEEKTGTAEYRRKHCWRRPWRRIKFAGGTSFSVATLVLFCFVFLFFFGYRWTAGRRALDSLNEINLSNEFAITQLEFCSGAIVVMRPEPTLKPIGRASQSETL